MLGKKELNVTLHLHAEIARLKQIALEVEDKHRTELSSWTRKCGQMGNEIGTMRKQLAEQQIDHQATLGLWTAKCGQMGNEIGRLRKQLVEKESDLETLNLWSAKCGQMGNEIGRLREKLADQKSEMETLSFWTSNCNRMSKEIDQLRKQLAEQESDLTTLNLLTKKCGELDNEIGRLRQQSLEKEIYYQTVVDQTVHNNEGVRTEKTLGDFKPEMDEAKNVNNSTLTEHAIESIRQENDMEQVNQDEEAKRKPKFPFWTTFKKRVSLKGKVVNSGPLIHKVSGTE